MEQEYVNNFSLSPKIPVHPRQKNFFKPENALAMADEAGANQMFLFFLYPRRSPSIPGKKAFFSRGYTGIYGDEKQKHHLSYGGTPGKHPFIPGKSTLHPRLCHDPAF